MQTFKCPKFSYLPGGILGTFLLKCARSVVVLSTLPSCCNLVNDSVRAGHTCILMAWWITSDCVCFDCYLKGLLKAKNLCLQGVNKDSYLILETLPTEYDSRVKAMEVDERPTEQYSDIGGLDKQIQEVIPV